MQRFVRGYCYVIDASLVYKHGTHNMHRGFELWGQLLAAHPHVHHVHFPINGYMCAGLWLTVNFPSVSAPSQNASLSVSNNTVVGSNLQQYFTNLVKLTLGIRKPYVYCSNSYCIYLVLLV